MTQLRTVSLLPETKFSHLVTFPKQCIFIGQIYMSQINLRYITLLFSKQNFLKELQAYFPVLCLFDLCPGTLLLPRQQAPCSQLFWSLSSQTGLAVYHFFFFYINSLIWCGKWCVWVRVCACVRVCVCMYTSSSSQLSPCTGWPRNQLRAPRSVTSPCTVSVILPSLIFHSSCSSSTFSKSQIPFVVSQSQSIFGQSRSRKSILFQSLIPADLLLVLTLCTLGEHCWLCLQRISRICSFSLISRAYSVLYNVGIPGLVF